MKLEVTVPENYGVAMVIFPVKEQNPWSEKEVEQ
jgi:hypothetical protein